MAQALAKYNFKDKVVLITGGGSGIGKTAATAFAKAGAKVIIAGRDANKLKQVSKEITCSYFPADVESQKSAEKLVSQTTKKFGHIDVLINCAGVYGPIGEFHGNNLEQWHEAININLLGTVNMIHAVLPVMLKRKSGKIINLSGGGAVQPFPNFSAYATSKAAVVRFTENLAKEYQTRNIQINAIAPGAINTSFLEKVLKAKDKAGKDFYKKSLEQKKTGGDSPEQAAELMLFLAGETNKLTGKILSAKWDKWQELDSKKIKALNLAADYTLRRIDNKYFKATGHE